MINYTDHLGNIRLSYSKDPATNVLKIMEENHYYPFGLKHSGYNSDQLILSRVSSTLKIIPIPPLFLTSYKYKFQGQEFQDELGLNWYSFKWRNYDCAIGRFMNIDPLSEKYAHQSHYNFSENRVIDGYELEGLEVVLINPTKSASTEQQKAADQRIADGASSIPSNSKMITVAAHGNPNYIKNDVRDEKITSGKQLNALLTRNSDDWKNRESNDGMTVVLYSCRTGANEKNKDGSIKDISVAQHISASEEFKDVEIIAPDQRVYFTSYGVVGAYEAENAGPDDEYKTDSNGKTKSKERSSTPGNWNVFKNGELIRSYQGNWTPTNTPGWWDELTKQN